uniref:Putative deddy 3'-5' exonuclease protein n=1 Tax=Culex tarsalis TaxID=7177 RepID=A0A1Q3FE19_CULTA
MDKTDLVKGQTVLLELEGECVIGQVLHLGSDRSFVRLQNVRDFQSNQPILGNQDYYNSEIRTIKIIEQSEPTATNVQQQQQRSAGSAVSSSEAVAKINLEDIQTIFDRIDNHIFIHQTDMKYHDAIKYLKTQKLLALAVEGAEGGRCAENPSLLSIATPDRIFIFDIMWMRITADLKAILANPKIRRVIHNGRLAEDVLKHRFGAPLGRSFDTMVAHVATTKNYDYQSEMSVEKCLAKYLNLPGNFFDSSITFENRPLNECQRKAAAKNVAFLLTLQDYFIHEVMLESFYGACNRYGTSLAGNANHIHTVIKLNEGRNEDLHDIERFELNINEELGDGTGEEDEPNGSVQS